MASSAHPSGERSDGHRQRHDRSDPVAREGRPGRCSSTCSASAARLRRPLRRAGRRPAPRVGESVDATATEVMGRIRARWALGAGAAAGARSRSACRAPRLREVAGERGSAAQRLGDAHRRRTCSTGSRCAPTSISIPPSPSSGTRPRGSTCASTPTPTSSASPTRSAGPSCPIPDCGREWLPTLPPVVLEQWPVADALERRRAHHGRPLAQLRLDPPRRRPLRPEGALAAAADRPAAPRSGPVRARARDPPRRGRGPRRAARRTAGRCSIRRESPRPRTTTAASSRARGPSSGSRSRATWSSDSGWFSDRSACYLARGRPVIAQDTGFGRRLPTGAGLFAFATADDVVAAIEELRARLRAPPRGGPRDRGRAPGLRSGARVAAGAAVPRERRAPSDRELIDAARREAAIGTRSPGSRATPVPLRDQRPARGAASSDRRRRGAWPLILKDLSRDRLLGDAAAAKPEFLLRARAASSRPIAASSRPAGIGPRCFAAVAEPERPALLAAHREGARRRALAGRGARGLGGRWRAGSAGSTRASRADSTSCEPPIRTCSSTTASWFRSWCERARRRRSRSPPTTARPALAGRARALRRRSSTRSPTLPRTFVHGELYPSNVLVDAGRAPARRSVRSTGRWPRSGRGSLDLAALVGRLGAARAASGCSAPTSTASTERGARRPPSRRRSARPRPLSPASRAPVARLVGGLAAAARARPRLARRGARAHARSWGSR